MNTNPSTARIDVAKSRITSAFQFDRKVEPPAMIWPLHYIIFGTDPAVVPADIFDDPAVMTRFQVDICERHLAGGVNDDFVPYLTPYLGTGILASAFGCETHFAPGRDPSVAAPCVTSIEEAKRLRPIDPERDGLCPRVLATGAWMREHGPYPVGLTDSQSPLDELVLICGHERFYMWMFDEPALVHDLMSVVTESFIAWVKKQKEVFGEAIDACHGEQGVWIPQPCGVWMADDEAVNLPADLYATFIAPYYKKIFAEFSGGVLHFCGDGSHHASTFLAMDGLRAINAGPMGAPVNLAKLQRATQGRIPLIYQELSPSDPESYFHRLLSGLDPCGVVFAPQVTDRVATGNSGPIEVNQDRTKAAVTIHQALRRAITARQQEILKHG
jgi:hypothetical protein